MANYIKIPVSFFESEPIKCIENMPGADGTILLYLHLLCQAHKKNRHGIFTIGTITLTDGVLGNIFPYSDIGVRLETLEHFGLIKRKEKSIQVFRFWDDLHDRNSQRYRKWRTGVFERDGFRCVECGAKKDIQAHHIKSWKKNKELRYVISNGVTLCRCCHLKAHGGCWHNG
jgi:hypothetical protein